MKKDPHADEPTQELDKVTYLQYLEALGNAKAWKQEADRLQAMLDEQLGDAYAGTIDGRKLVTHRPTERWAESTLIKDNPDLTQHYFKQKVVEVFDFAAFRSAHPDVAEKYRVRSFRTIVPTTEVDYE